MIDNFSFHEKQINHLEKQCIYIIEENLEMFFTASIKAACAYSLMISKDYTSFNSDTFGKMVFSNRELEAFIERVQSKLNNEMENYLGYYVSTNYKCFDAELSLESLAVLQDTVERFRDTQKLIRGCEKLIQNVFGKTFKSLCPYPALHHVVKKINIGEKILSKKSYSSQIDRQQEIILRQIQGMLQNIKLTLRNQLVQQTIENINYITENMEQLNNYAIA